MPKQRLEKLPFDQAIQFLQDKIKLPTSGYTDIFNEQHSHAFVVAGAASDALVEDFYNAIIQAKTAGQGYDDFRKSFDTIVEKHGWAHNGSPGWRSKIIYDTNIRQAYNAGRYQQMVTTKDLNPYWEYHHTSIEHPRLQHKAWDGLILPADDPWWDTHHPQNGWNCRCKVFALTEFSARKAWEARGLTGPDTAPPLELEEHVIGKNGSNPRTVTVPKGIDPGFAYNPGKAYLEPHTVPPLTGFDAVIQERNAPWPTGFTPPPPPAPVNISPNILLPADTKPAVAVDEFLSLFGATVEQGATFADAAGSTVVITKALFEDGKGNFKWLAKPEKADRLQYVNVLALTLIEPDEIWWNWEEDREHSVNNPDQPKKWRLKRRYLRAFSIEGVAEYAISVFEWGRSGWSGSTAFVAEPSNATQRLKYFNKQRVGRLVYKKD